MPAFFPQGHMKYVRTLLDALPPPTKFNLKKIETMYLEYYAQINNTDFFCN